MLYIMTLMHPLAADTEWRGSFRCVSLWRLILAVLQQLQKAWPAPHLHNAYPCRATQVTATNEAIKADSSCRTPERLRRSCTFRPSVSSTAFNQNNGAKCKTVLPRLTPCMSTCPLAWIHFWTFLAVTGKAQVLLTTLRLALCYS